MTPKTPVFKNLKKEDATKFSFPEKSNCWNRTCTTHQNCLKIINYLSLAVQQQKISGFHPWRFNFKLFGGNFTCPFLLSKPMFKEYSLETRYSSTEFYPLSPFDKYHQIVNLYINALGGNWAIFLYQSKKENIWTMTEFVICMVTRFFASTVNGDFWRERVHCGRGRERPLLSRIRTTQTNHPSLEYGIGCKLGFLLP